MTMKLRLGRVILIVACVSASVVWSAHGQSDAPIDDAQLAREAKQALTNDDPQRALELLDQIRSRHPQLPEVPYNMGVAAYRSGDYERAAELFAQALSMTSDPKLRSDSAYNLGTSAYAQSLDAESPLISPNASQQLDRASSELRRALEHYRQALDLAPDNADARANAELAFRRLRNLEAMKKQLQQTQPQQQQMPQDQPQEQPDPQQQDQQQQPSEQSDDRRQQQPPQNQQPDQQTEQDQQTSSVPPQPQSSQDPGQQQQQDSQAEQQPSGSARDDSEIDPEELEQPEQANRPPSSPPDPEKMTRDEAERLLQMVRDQQRRRQEQRQRESAARRPPVDKDW